MTERFSCALTSRSLEEPCYGTASQVRRWVLVEHPGPWGADAVMQSGLPSQLATKLAAVTRSAGARLLLIRRYGRSAPTTPRRCFAVVSTAAMRRVERLAFDDVDELLDVDWAALGRLDPVGGELVDGPLCLVCTHGNHDTCCARFGRPVAQILDQHFGQRVWEVSHVGGDRFAGNLVLLPEGVYYGRVDPTTAVEIVEGHRAGRVDLRCYRGRSFLPFVAQAAEYFVRQERGLHQLDDALPRGCKDLGGDRFEVVVDLAGGEAVTATLERFWARDARQLTCDAAGEQRPPRFRLLSLQ